MEGGYAFKNKDGIIQHHNGGKMFGFATKKDIEALEARFEGLRKATAEKSKDLSTKLYTVEVFNPGGNKLGTYRDVYWIDYNPYGTMSLVVGSLMLKTRNGDTILRGNGYTYIATEQKPEAEKALFDYGGVSWLSQIDRHIDRLLDQPVNVRSLTLAREEMEREWAKKFDRVSRVVSGLTTDVCLLQGDVSTLKEITRDQAKNHDALNHRIEMLELRLGSQSFGKQTEPTKKNPQPKGAKR